MKRGANKNKFLKNLSPILGITLILVAVVVFSVSVRSNMTGNVACTIGTPKNSAAYTTPDCYYARCTYVCAKFIGTWNYWKSTGCGKITPLWFSCTNGAHCEGRGMCSSSTCKSIGYPTSVASECCSGNSNGNCCNPVGATSAAFECCSTRASGGKCVRCDPSCYPTIYPCGQVFDNGCGGTCASRGTKCDLAGYTCSNRACIPNSAATPPATPSTPTPPCTPNCAGKVCGSNGCPGGSCGKCSGWTYCDNGQCARI